MQTKWIVFLVAVWIFGSMFGGVVETTYLGEDEVSELEKLVGLETYSIMNIPIPKPSMAWVTVVGKMMLWDYAMFKNSDGSANEWAIVKWMIFIPISAGLTVTFVTTFLPMIIQGARVVRPW